MHRLLSVLVTAFLMTVSAATASAEIISIDGTVQSVDVEKRTITVEVGGKSRTLDVSRKAKIVVEGKELSLDSIRAKQQVSLSYHDQLEVVVKMTVGNVADEKNREGFVPLFNGRDLTGWQGKIGDPPEVARLTSAQRRASQRKADESARRHWTIRDEVLHYDGKGTSLVTMKDFGNFELYVDWKIQSGGDTGIYLRGVPQVQIWDPSRPVAMGVGSGGLFNNKIHPSRPLVNADFEIGAWNTFRIRMIDQTVSVWLNQELVVEEVILENYWDQESPVNAVGPIELQHFGSHLEFRNILIKELE